MSGKRLSSTIALGALVLLWAIAPATAYIEAPYSLGRLCTDLVIMGR